MIQYQGRDVDAGVSRRGVRPACLTPVAVASGDPYRPVLVPAPSDLVVSEAQSTPHPGAIARQVPNAPKNAKGTGRIKYHLQQNSSIDNSFISAGMPDLNSVPPSPHTLATSRRQSTSQMATPPVPTSPSLNILPSNQNAVNHPQSPSLPSPQLAATHPPVPAPAHALAAEPWVGPGPGPERHPRPLTAAELHLQLEKEQEAVVNRLTRELSLLRAAQNASVVSNTSSNSGANSTHDAAPEQSLLSGSGFSIPTARQHQRTSSTTSQSFGQPPLSSSYEARIHAPRAMQATSLSRQNSSTSRHSQTNSPGPQNSLDPSSYFQHQRIPPPTSVPMSSVGATPGSGSVSEQLSPGLMPATMRYEETAFYRNELETAKRENEALKHRIRELERHVRQHRTSDASRTRSDSVSTTASMSVTPAGGVSIAGPREGVLTPARPERERGLTTQSMISVTGSIGVGVPEEEVKVGESAASSGLPHNS
ncbi:hypothetical protein AK830_g11019 [Neonectria ditissima]|uniref:Uncharacterized protein n=1 Tax=Neonectria ditissima TaxID=78410 RepID=A0A0P7AS45_9HYPO|nr:hypothetical protein AK830_g11019 [Neonectria ditissima]